MMVETFYYIFHAVLIAVFSFVYVIILQQPDKVLGPVVKLVDPFFNRNGFLRWIYKPIMSCAHCNAGQIALWSYMALYGFDDYNVFYHIGFISISVLTVQILISKYG
jgi:hypothetical protein